MPITFALSADTLQFQTRGDVEFSEGLEVMRSGFQSLSAASAAAGGWHLLFDIQFSSENRSTFELQRIADFIIEHRARLSGRCAIVVEKSLHFGLARMVGTFLDSAGLVTHVCRDRSEAERWLRSPSGPGLASHP